MEQFKHPQWWPEQGINVKAMIEEARANVMVSGSFDVEPEILDSTWQEFESGRITAREAEERVSDLLASRQDYH